MVLRSQNDQYNTGAAVLANSSRDRMQALQNLTRSATAVAANGTPVQMQLSRRGLIISKAILCYRDNWDVTQDERYYCESFPIVSSLLKGTCPSFLSLQASDHTANEEL